MKHFLTGTELGRGDLLALLDSAAHLKKHRSTHAKPLAGKTLALMFEKPSLRTHLSFSVAMRELGGEVVESFSLNRKKEEPEDVARVVSGYCHGVMLRTHEHSILEQRIFQFLCWVYGSDPAEFRSLVGSGGLPKSRAVRCGAEWAQLKRSWDTLLAPHVIPPAAPPAPAT